MHTQNKGLFNLSLWSLFGGAPAGREFPSPPLHSLLMLSSCDIVPACREYPSLTMRWVSSFRPSVSLSGSVRRTGSALPSLPQTSKLSLLLLAHTDFYYSSHAISPFSLPSGHFPYSTDTVCPFCAYRDSQPGTPSFPGGKSSFCYPSSTLHQHTHLM